MNALARSLRDAFRDRSSALDLLRIYLGIGLFARGVVFVARPDAFYGLLDATDPSSAAAFLAHYVAIAHLAGGLLLAAGLLTRLAAIVQIPILLGAVFVIHLGEGLAAPGQGFEFASLVLILLIAFAVYGSGRLSLDHLIFSADTEEPVRPYRIAERPRLEGELAPGVPAGRTDVAWEGRCTCGGRDRAHPSVVVERRYGLGGALRFVTGTTGRPIEIVFRCRDCGGVVERSTDPEDLAYYRYNEEKRRVRRPRLRRRAE